MSAEVSFSNPPAPVSDALLVALFIAAILHAVVILGLNFTMPKAEKINRTIAVTIANMPSKKAPEKSQFLAQQNQQAAGSKTTERKPPAQKIPTPGGSGKQLMRKSEPENRPEKVKPLKVITRKQAEQKITTLKKTSIKKNKKRRRLSVDSLARQVAQLGAEVRYKKQSSKLSRIKFINSISTHKFLAAQYMEDWRRKVEKTGNMNYPEIARKKHFTGKLTMDVGIRHNGSIYSIRISKSSGYQLLDDAAKRIVRMSAPFAPLPKALRKELDVLIITRVWEFSDESGMFTQ